jgi:hypothetical protein
LVDQDLDFHFEVGDNFPILDGGGIAAERSSRKTERRYCAATLDCMKPLSFVITGADRIKLLVSSSLLAFALTSQAHPGHDLRDASPQHLLTSPDHLALLALGGVALWLAGRFVQRQLARRLLQGAGLAAVVTAAVVWGVRI